MTYFKIIRGNEVVGIGYSEENDVSMYNDKFEYIEITKKQYEKLEKEFNNYVTNRE